jgi:hypothetical protein
VSCHNRGIRCFRQLWVPLAWLLRLFLHLWNHRSLFRWNLRSRFWQLAGRDALSARKVSFSSSIAVKLLRLQTD